MSPTCAVSLVPGPQQRAGLLVLAFLPLPLVLALVWEGVDALVPAGVAVRVVDDHVVGGNRQVNPQLVTGQASLRLPAEQRRAVLVLQQRLAGRAALTVGRAAAQCALISREHKRPVRLQRGK